MTQDQEDTLLSALAEADRYVRETPRDRIDPVVVRRLLDEATAQLPSGGQTS